MTKLDEKLIKTMEDEILSLMDYENEKMLSIIEFYLFWSYMNSMLSFEHPSLFQHISRIKEISNLERNEY